MNEWRTTTLGEIITLQRGFDLTEKSSTPGPYPVISSGGAAYTTNIAKVAGPGVITGRKGVLGKVHFATDSYWPHDTTLWVKDFKGSDPRFIYYLLQTLPLASLDAGASNPTLNRNHAHLLPVRIPSPHIQQQISAVLGALDDLMMNNRRRIDLLESMSHAIYREWFVHFRYPEHVDDTRIDSALGRIPEAWGVHPLAEIARLVRGRSYRKTELAAEGGVPFVNLKCMMRGGGFRRDGIKRYVGPFTAEQQVREGDIVLAVTDLTQGREILARASLVPPLQADFGVISLDVLKVLPRDEADRLALLFALRSTDFADRVKEYANGSTVLHLPPSHVSAGLVLWPDARLRRQFIEIAEPMIRQAVILADATNRCTAVRDLLLPKLVTGQIDVSDLGLEAAVESVV